MSRCLPFSAEAYAKRGLNQEALIKLQKEKDEKSERRKEKELKRKAKKEHKDKERKTKTVYDYDKTKKLKEKKEHKSKTFNDAGFPPSEQLEKSDITEEHDLPSCSGSTCNFLDSVDSNNKRKRQDVTVDTVAEKRRNVLRIRLRPKKIDGPNALAVEQPEICPSKGSEACVQKGNEEQIAQAKSEVKPVLSEQVNLKPCLELPLSTSETKSSKISKSSKSSKSSKAALSYKTLIEDWVPDVPSCNWLGQSESDDEDWLFGSKPRQHGSEESKIGPEVSCSRSTALWPLAMRLPEVEIFALPYTVPF